MTKLNEKLTVCIAIVRDKLNTQIFGVYDNEQLAKKRVEELNCMLSPETSVIFINDIVWEEANE